MSQSKRPIPGGFLLAIEGVDGVGKSSQVEALARVLRARGLDHVVTREPTQGVWGRKLRDSAARGRLSPEDELHAFMEDRKEHVRELINPSLAAGKIVVTDRYYFSTVAYQGAGRDAATLLRDNEAFAPQPHLLVVIDLDPETSLARIGRRDPAASQFETLAQLAKARAVFLALDKPYLVRLDGRARPDDLRDQILVAFICAAVQRIVSAEWLDPREKLEAMQQLHGGPVLES